MLFIVNERGTARHIPSCNTSGEHATSIFSDNETSMPTRRIPDLGHVLLLFLLLALSFILCEAIGLGIAGSFHGMDQTLRAMQNQHLQLLINISAYILTLAAASLFFPALWRGPFLTGLQWNVHGAAFWLLPFGLALGFVAQGVSTLLPMPRDMPVEALFRNPSLIWTLVLFGSLLAPLFEEIVFRGFLLPALSIAVDYLRLPRELQALDTWRDSNAFSTPALAFSSIATSLLFALIHAPQLGLSWPSVSLLAAVSLILCYVRLRTASVAASTLVHASYNLSVFLTLFATSDGFRHLDRITP